VTAALLAGALIGLGCYLLYRALAPSRLPLAAALARVDKARYITPSMTPDPANELDRVRRRVGSAMSDFYESRGWRRAGQRADLALLEKSWEGFLASKVLLALGGLIFAAVGGAFLSAGGLPISYGTPLWLGLLIAMFFFVLPDLTLRQEAADKRRDFRHVIGSFLDLVSMNLAGGRGVPEALVAAVSVGDGWAMARLRTTLTNARLAGYTQWEALGRLGDELDIAELRDLSAALTLVADDGAKVRSSLTARAATMRRRELADVEGAANERSQSMLVAQMLLCTGFLIFLAYPAVQRVLQL
jgi:tight adherence protein C